MTDDLTNTDVDIDLICSNNKLKFNWIIGMDNQISVSAILCSLLIIVLTIYIYRYHIKPYKQFQLYKRILSSSYNTLVCPYSILGTGGLSRQRQDFRKYNDSHYSVKTIYTKYQVVLANVRGEVFIDLIDPSLIRQFYERNLQGCYKKYENTPFMKGLSQVTGKGLLFSEGVEWKNKKRIMSSVFNFDFIKSKIKTITEITVQKIKQVQEMQENKAKELVRVDLNNLFQRIYGNVVIKCFFGDIKLQKLQNRQIFSYFNHLLQRMSVRSYSIIAFLFPKIVYQYKFRPIDREVNRMISTFRNYATDVIKEQVKKTKQKDSKDNDGKFVGVIEKLVRESQLKEEDEVNANHQNKSFYTIKDLIDQFATFFVAGSETTASMATVLMYLLAKHPQVEAKVRKQIEQVVGDDISNLTFQKLKQLVYLEKVQKQTLRMYSPTAGVFPREVIKDHLIGNIPFKKGMIVTIKIKSNHHKDQFYSNPLVFNPDRWNDLDSSKVDAYSYFPFSAGQRNCIGQHLALIQSKIAILILLKRYKAIVPDKLDFKMVMRGLYSVENMLTTLQKA